MKCDNCHLEFPDHMVNEFHLETETKELDAVCALKERNKLHGLPPDTPFNGTAAQKLYSDTVEYIQQLDEQHRKKVFEELRKSDNDWKWPTFKL